MKKFILWFESDPESYQIVNALDFQEAEKIALYLANRHSLRNGNKPFVEVDFEEFTEPLENHQADFKAIVNNRLKTA